MTTDTNSRSLFDDTGSGGSAAASSSELTPSEGAVSAPPPGSTNTSTPSASDVFKFPENWRDTLPDDLKAEPSLGTIHDLSSLAKSYVNAQKMIGQDKVVIPGKHATKEDWQAVYQKLGLPKEFKDYKVDLPEGHGLDNGFIERFTKRAFEQGVMPTAAKEILAGYIEDYKEALGGSEEASKKMREEGFANLDKEWGEKYKSNRLAIQLLVNDFADDTDKKYLNDSGLIDDPGFWRLAAKIGGTLKEGELKGQLPRNEFDAKDPATAEREINTIYADAKHPYNDKSHPNHKAAVADMSKLFSQAYPKPREK